MAREEYPSDYQRAVQLSNDQHPEGRKEASRIFGSVDVKRSLVFLAVLAHDHDNGVKREAIRSIGRWKEPSMTSILGEVLKRDDLPLDVRILAGMNIYHSNQKNGIEALNFHLRLLTLNNDGSNETKKVIETLRSFRDRMDGKCSVIEKRGELHLLIANSEGVDRLDLIRKLNDTNVYQGDRVVWFLRDIILENCSRGLIDQEIRAAAAIALGKIKTEDTADVLNACLETINQRIGNRASIFTDGSGEPDKHDEHDDYLLSRLLDALRMRYNDPLLSCDTPRPGAYDDLEENPHPVEPGRTSWTDGGITVSEEVIKPPSIDDTPVSDERAEDSDDGENLPVLSEPKPNSMLSKHRYVVKRHDPDRDQDKGNGEDIVPPDSLSKRPFPRTRRKDNGLHHSPDSNDGKPTKREVPEVKRKTSRRTTRRSKLSG